jgi:hypothetical protein
MLAECSRGIPYKAAQGRRECGTFYEIHVYGRASLHGLLSKVLQILI